MADRWTQFLQHPATLMGAGIMAGADPRGEGLGGVGTGIMAAGQAVRQQELDRQRAAQMQAQQEYRQFQMQQAQAQAQQAEQQRQQRQSYLSTLDPELAARLQAYPELAGEFLGPSDPTKPLVVPHRASVYEGGQFRRPPGAGAQEPATPAERFKMETTLRNNFDKSTQAFRTVADAWGSIQAIGGDPVEQLALVTKIMKMLDPGSVVRESEIGMAMQTSGLFDQMLQLAKKVQGGDVLSPTQQRRFRNLGKRLYDAAEKEYRKVHRTYGRRVKNYGLDPANVITDYALEEPGAILPEPTQERTEAAPTPMEVDAMIREAEGL